MAINGLSRFDRAGLFFRKFLPSQTQRRLARANRQQIQNKWSKRDITRRFDIKPASNKARGNDRSLFSRQQRKSPPSQKPRLQEARVQEAQVKNNDIGTIEQFRSGEDDGALILRQIMTKPKPEDLLQSLHHIAVNPAIAQSPNRNMTRAVQTYQEQFYVRFHEQLQSLSFAQIKQLDAYLNSPKMRLLRGGLQLAQLKGLDEKSPAPNAAAVRKEIGHISKDLEHIVNLIQAEKNLRTGGASDIPTKPMILKDWKNHRSSQKILKSLAKNLQGNISFGRGRLPDFALKPIEDDFILLARQNEKGAPNRKKGKEAGIAFAKENDPKSKELNVTDNYIKDIARGEVVFDDGKKALSPQQLGLSVDKRQAISDHLTRFCGGRANQARRLSALMSQQAFFPIFKQQISGILARHPFLPYDHEIQLQGASDHALYVKKHPNGDIDLHMKMTLYPFQAYGSAPNNPSQSSPQSFPIDDRKSYNEMTMVISVPKAKSAPPKITQCDYETHIVGGAASAR